MLCRFSLMIREAARKAYRPLFFLCTGFLPSFAWAGAWTQPEGKSQLITNFSFYKTTEKFSEDDGERQATPRFTKYEINPYYEYGWRDGITLGGSTFLQRLRQRGEDGQTEDNEGIGETELFARFRVWEDGPAIVSVQPLIKLPPVYRDGDGPKAGRREHDVELSLLGGYGFSWLGQDHYLGLRGGYRRRFGLIGDQWKFDAELGLRYDEHWMLRPQLSVTGKGDDADLQFFSVSGQNNYDLTRLQLVANYRISERYTVEFGGFKHIGGDNTGAGGGVMTSLWITW